MNRAVGWILLLLVSILSITAISEMSDASVGDTFTHDGFTFRVLSDAIGEECVSAIDYDGHDLDMRIPDTVTYGGTEYMVTLFDMKYMGSANYIQSLHMPRYIDAIAENMLDHYIALKQLTVDPDNPYMSAENGMLFNKDKTVTIAMSMGYEGTYVVPESVRTIGPWTFEKCFKIDHIVISEGTEVISYRAFMLCSYLKSIEIPSTVTYMDFTLITELTGLESITVAAGNSVYTSKDGVMYTYNMKTLLLFPPESKITDFIIPNTVDVAMGAAMWKMSNVKYISIPTYMQDLGISQFLDCPRLRAINVNLDNERYASDNGVLYDTIDKTLIKYPCNRDGTSYSVMDGTVTIGNESFMGAGNLRSVIIPDGVTHIGTNTFNGCSGLESITMPSTIAYIGEGSFKGCTSMKRLDVGDGAPYASVDGVLYDSSMTVLINYPANRDAAVYELPSTVTHIETDAFEGCGNLMTITVQEGNAYFTSIDGVLYDMGLEELIRYPAKKSDPVYRMPDTLTTIRDNAMELNAYVEYVFIPSSVSYIGGFAFTGCSGMKEIVVDSDNPTYASISGVLYDKGITELIWYPKNRIHSTYTMPSTVSSVAEHALSYCRNLERFIVEEGNEHFFADTNGILYNFDRTVLIAYPSGKGSMDSPMLDSTYRFENGSFAGTEMESIVIPNHITELGEYVFAYSEELESVTLGKGITYIGRFDFEGCSSLKKIVIAHEMDTLTIGSGTFRYCDDSLKFESGRDGYILDVYYDSNFTREYDPLDQGFNGVVYLKWTEHVEEEEPVFNMIVGGAIASAILIGLIVFVLLRRRA